MKCIEKAFLFLVIIFSGVFFTISYPFLTFAATKVETKTKAEKVIAGSLAEKIHKANASFDADRMADMSDYDPANPVTPTGDTIKIAVVSAFSGASAVNGQFQFMVTQWAAHDINKRGGIWVDGKKKLIEVIKADNMSKQDQCKKISERMVLQEKVHFLVGTPGTNLMKIINEVGNKYKVIVWNFASLGDELQDATNFSRYTFMGSYSTESVSRGLAYYSGQISKREKKFYILNQDYGFGHQYAEGFKKGLKEYYPEAKIVGEDYHKLFLTDFAPYLTKIKAAGADAIFTGDWAPDGGNLLKQARQLGIRLPFLTNYMTINTNQLAEVGVEGTKGIVHIDQFDMPNAFKNQGYVKFNKAWTNAWQKWPVPYNGMIYQHGAGFMASYCMQIYWLLSAVERAKSLDAEKIIGVLENDSYQYVNGKIVKMRACDHKVIQDLSVTELVPPEQQKISMSIPPFYWFKNISWTGQLHVVPAAKILPWMDQNLDRCKGKNDWGEQK